MYIRNSVFSRTRLAYSQNTFVGNYSRTLNVPTVFTRTGYYTGNYQRTRPTEVTVDLGDGEFQTFYTDIPAPSYIGDYTRDFAGNYSRTRYSTFTAGVTYEGNYSRSFQGNFVGNYARDKSYSRNFAGNFVGNYTREFNYTRDSIGAGGTVTSTRNSIGGGTQITDLFNHNAKAGLRTGWLYTVSTGVMEVLINVCSYFFIDRIGRRWCMLVSFLLCGISVGICRFLPHENLHYTHFSVKTFWVSLVELKPRTLYDSEETRWGLMCKHMVHCTTLRKLGGV